MSELTQEELLKNQEEITKLGNINAKSLPDSPSRVGYSSAEIKRHLYAGEFWLLNKIQGLRKILSDIDTDNSDVKASIEDLENALNEIKDDLDEIAINNYSVAYNLVVNRNGYQFSGYKFETLNTSDYGNYTIKQFKTNSGTVVKDLDNIKAYLKSMTGHSRIPTYNQKCPSDEFLILSKDNTIWKLQYDTTNGLLAFKVENMPNVFGKGNISIESTEYIIPEEDR